jgi:hypothetical protein
LRLCTGTNKTIILTVNQIQNRCSTFFFWFPSLADDELFEDRSLPSLLDVYRGLKQRTLSASAVEENVQWKAIPIDLPQEDNSYVSTAEIARKKREQGLNKQFNNTLNSDSSLYKSDPELINIQRKHFRKNCTFSSTAEALNVRCLSISKLTYEDLFFSGIALVTVTE